ncbi:hypothetical protein M569_11882, partial [Genlisea aurea]
FVLLPVILIALQSVIIHLHHRIRKLPPTLFPNLLFVGHIYLLKKPIHKSLAAAARRHGPVLFLRIGSRPVLLVSSPGAAEECLGSRNDVVFANRPEFLNGRYFGYNYTSLSWSSYGEHWRNLRRISSSELLSNHRLASLSHVRADEALGLVRKLAEESRENDVVTVKSPLFEFMFNVLTRMITGRRYYGKDSEKSAEAKLLENIWEETSKVAFETNVVDFLPLMRWFAGFRNVEKKLKSIQRKRDRFMQKVIDDQRREMMTAADVPRKKTIVEVLLDLQAAEPEYYTDETIKNLLLVLLQGGSSTSTIAFEWAFSLLLSNPETLRKAQSEIDEVVGTGRLISESDLQRLPYLHHVILETLRLRPPAPILVPHRSSAECTVSGFRIPAGTILLVNVWEIQHSPEIWSDPESFRPERFEGSDAKKVLGMRFFPFGWGRRACPGENLSLLNIGLGLGALIQCFDWEKVGEIDMTEEAGTTTPKAHPLMARCCPRPFISTFIS